MNCVRGGSFTIIFIVLISVFYVQDSRAITGWTVEEVAAGLRSGLEVRTGQTGATIEQIGEAIKATSYVDGVSSILISCGAIKVPVTVSRNQIYAIILKYFEENPEFWNQPTELVVYSALRGTFPGPEWGQFSSLVMSNNNIQPVP